MTSIVRRPNFDSELSLRPDHRGHGSLEILIRTELRPFEPGVTPGSPTIAMTPFGDSVPNQTASYVRGWTAESFAELRRDFFRVVQEHWNERLFLVHRSAGGARLPRFAGAYPAPRVLRCRLRLVPSSAEPQMVLLAARTAAISPSLRVYMCGLGGQGDQGHSCAGNLAFLNQPAARRWSGPRRDLDGLITDRDVRLVSTQYVGRTWWQIPAVHEVGHYLGLPHVNAGNGPSAGADAEYGLNAHQCSDVMGRGMRVDDWHAQPWLFRLGLHLESDGFAGAPGRWTLDGWRPSLTEM